MDPYKCTSRPLRVGGFGDPALSVMMALAFPNESLSGLRHTIHTHMKILISKFIYIYSCVNIYIYPATLAIPFFVKHTATLISQNFGDSMAIFCGTLAGCMISNRRKTFPQQIFLSDSEK